MPLRIADRLFWSSRVLHIGVARDGHDVGLSMPAENLNGMRGYDAVGSHRRLRAVLVYIAHVCGVAVRSPAACNIVMQAARTTDCCHGYLLGWGALQRGGTSLGPEQFLHGDGISRHQTIDDSGRRSENRISRVDRTEGPEARTVRLGPQPARRLRRDRGGWPARAGGPVDRALPQRTAARAGGLHSR